MATAWLVAPPVLAVDPDGGSTPSFSGAPAGNGLRGVGTRSCCPDPRAIDGVGVAVDSGELHWSMDFAQTAGVMEGFTLHIDYGSRSLYDGYAGFGNVTMFDEVATVLSGGHVEILMEDGIRRTWTKDGSTFTAPQGVLDTLTGSGSNYIRTSPDGRQRQYGPKLTSMNDRFGNAVTITRDGNGDPSSVTDTRGVTHAIELWANTKRLKKITTDDGRAWTFKYDANANLNEVKGPATTSFANGITLLFAYSSGYGEAERNHNMTSAIDGRGNTWMSAQYDAADRVSTQTVGGQSLTFAYGTPTTYKTTVTDRAGNERVWEWDQTTLARKSLVEKTNRGVRTGEGDYTTAWGSDADGYITSVTSPRGNGVKWTLNAAKLPTVERRKSDMSAQDNDTNDIVTTTAYDSSKYYGVSSRTDARGNTTSYTLNAYGQPTTITHPTVTYLDPDVTVVEYRSYNANGTLATATDGEGKVTSFSYFTTPASKKGRLSSRVVDYGGLNLTASFDYDGAGHLTSATDPRGNTTGYVVEAYGNVTEIDAPVALGYVTKFEYDANLNVTKKRVKNIDFDGTLLTPNWIDTTYTYTTMDRVASVTEMVTSGTTRTTNLAYDNNDNLREVSRGTRVVQLTYDERDLLYQKVGDPGTSPHIAATDTLDYDGNRNLVTWTNARNKATTYHYDLFDRRDKTTNALNHYESVVYDKDSNLLERASYEAGAPDVLLALHKQSYDEMGRFWKEEDLLKGTPDVSYARTATLDKRGLVTTLRDRLGNDTVSVYDGARRRTSRTDAVGNVTTWTYDANGNVTVLQETEKLMGTSTTETYETQFTYDALNRERTQKVIDRTDGTNFKLTEWKPDALGFVRKKIDPKGNEVTYQRDLLARMTEQSEDLGGGAAIVTQWTRNVHDEITQLLDDNSKATDYAYDELGRLTQKTYHDASTVQYVVDNRGNVTHVTDQNGTVTTQTFDDLDRMTARSLSLATGVGGPTSENFAFDGLNRLTEAKNDDSIVQFSYDSLSRVLSEVQGNNPLGTSGKTVSYSYDAESRTTQIAYPSGFAANHDRDAIGCLMEVKDQSQSRVAAFDLWGEHHRAKQISFGNSTSSSYGYDGFRRVTDISHATSTPTEFAGFAYAWDKNDNPLYEKRRHISGKGDVYSYDKANRLTRALTDVVDPAAEVANPGSQSYVDKRDYNMDDVFNLTSYVVTPYGGNPTTTSYTTNSLNEYTAVGGTTHTYDANGNLKDNGTYIFKYDGHSRLIEVRLKSDNSLVGSYKHDACGLGRRIKKTVGSLTTRFVYADQQAVEEYNDSTGSLIRLFVFGDRIDQILMMKAGSASYYYHTQLIGSVTHVTNSSQAVVESYQYDPYGKTTIRDGSGDMITASAIGNPYLFTARQLDEETGLYYYRARVYSPTLRRFIQRDPLEYVDGPNAYAYVRNRPTIAVDPSGEWGWVIRVAGTIARWGLSRAGQKMAEKCVGAPLPGSGPGGSPYPYRGAPGDGPPSYAQWRRMQR